MKNNYFLTFSALPKSGPTIRTERSRYYPGDVLKATCTTSPSKPAVNLEFFINNEKVIFYFLFDKNYYYCKC